MRRYLRVGGSPGVIVVGPGAGCSGDSLPPGLYFLTWLLQIAFPLVTGVLVRSLRALTRPRRLCAVDLSVGEV
mgnify:CR=1 FL=1